MDTPELSHPDSTPPYKDRSSGLILFGVLTILMGCVLLLFVPLMLFTPKPPNSTVSLSSMLPGLLMVGTMAVVTIWLGIGSTMARRWARALMLILSWSWLALGVFTSVFAAFVMPGIMATSLANMPTPPPGSNPDAIKAGMVGGMLFVCAIFVIIPVIWIIFYIGRNVKATVEARDPVTHWTDRCPLPVLAFCLWLVLSAPMMLVTAISSHGVIAFFGNFINGAPGTAVYLATVVIYLYCAWSLYKLEWRGWWLLLIVLCVFTISSFLTFSRHDPIEMYRAMNYSDAQIASLQNSPFLTPGLWKWIIPLSMAPYLLLLFFTAKYMRRKSV